MEKFYEKLLATVYVCIIILSLFGCKQTSISVNINNQEGLINQTVGKDSLVEIGGCLWYDSTTRIVYWWNGRLSNGSNCDTTPSPYYAPNGLPYRYNPKINALEQINT